MTLSEIRQQFRTVYDIIQAVRQSGNLQPEKVLQRKIQRYALPFEAVGLVIRLDPIQTSSLLFDPAAADQIIARIVKSSKND